MLVKAKKEGHLTEIKPVLERLKDAGFYLTDELITEILDIAVEG